MLINDLQPSQLYISRQKLADVQSWFTVERLAAIPVIELAGRYVITDGHTRVVAALLAGCSEVPTYLDTDDLDRSLYQTCVGWCLAAGITSPRDLLPRVIAEADYQQQWLDRCRAAFGD